MKLSVTILCYNAANTIGVQLDAVANQDWPQPWEVIVADNGSTDHSCQIVERYSDRVPYLHLIDASKRRGPAYARNVGARAARGEALAFCDADDAVNPGWVQAMREVLGQHDFVACRRDDAMLKTSLIEPYVDHFQQGGPMTLWFLPISPIQGRVFWVLNGPCMKKLAALMSPTCVVRMPSTVYGSNAKARPFTSYRKPSSRSATGRL